MKEWIVALLIIRPSFKPSSHEAVFVFPCRQGVLRCHCFSFLGFRFVFKELVNPLFQMEYEHYVILKKCIFG